MDPAREPEGQVALVMGGGRGIARLIAREALIERADEIEERDLNAIRLQR